MGWVCAGTAAVGVIVVLGFLLKRSPHYSRVFGDEHLIEFAGRIAQLKQVVLERIEDPQNPTMPTPDDPRMIRSSAGLVLFYTVTNEDGAYAHHYSLRDAQGYTAMAVGRTFVALTAYVLGIEPALIACERSENTVFHAAFTFDEAAQQAFVERTPRVPTASDVEETRKSVRDIAERLSIENVKTGLKFGG